ncbi:MAG: DUF1294 domain-containing protein [Lachnospiraceae bacterium]|nr:DUF1294 domain-containing protein [Lachnospiraceae bacterium]
MNLKFSMELLYQIVQIAAVVCILLWAVTMKQKKAVIACRSLALLLSVAAPILMYLKGLEKVPVLIWIGIGVTVAVFLVFAVDKLIAVKGKQTGIKRVPENVLLILSVVSIVGAITGMLVCHHKSKKAKLQYVVPVIAFVETGLLYLLLLRGKPLPAMDIKKADLFQVLALITAVVLVVTLVRTFILFRMLVILPASVAAGLYTVRLFCKPEGALSVLELIKAKPIPFFAAAALVFLILELLSVKSSFIVSGNEIREKSDHSDEK